MEGIRGFAVFLVFLVHYASLADPWIQKQTAVHSFAEAFHTIGNAGVDLFFVLSGYLIYGTLISREQQFLPFMARRLRRIYPAFTVVFLTYLALSFLFPAESKIPEEAPATYLLQNFLLLPGMLPIEPMITVAWSLSYEMFYYLVMPVVVSTLGLRMCKPELRVMLAGLAAVVISMYCAHFGGHIRLIMFIAGILLYEVVQSRQGRAPAGGVALLALIGGLAATLLPISGPMTIAILFASFYLFLICCFLRPTEWLAKAFSWTPLRWLGNMSYSYYLLHGLALKAAFLVLSKVIPPAEAWTVTFLFLLPAMFALTLVPTALLFILVERPLSLAPTKPHRRADHPYMNAPAKT